MVELIEQNEDQENAIFSDFFHSQVDIKNTEDILATMDQSIII